MAAMSHNSGHFQTGKREMFCENSGAMAGGQAILQARDDNFWRT
jgi:hypothetical protein